MGMAEILQKVSRSEKSICPKCFHNHVCLAINNQPCFECNQFVEVVRCKDCEWWMYEYDDVGLCVTDVPDVDGVQRHAEDFCSYGVKKGDGNA